MIRPIFALAALLLTCLPATAQNIQPDCSFIEESPKSCVRFVGCIGSEGTYFYGKSTGWNSGAVAGFTSDGQACQGTWENGSDRTKGEGFLNCGPTETAKFKYFARGKNFVVLSGVAISSAGRRMRTWAGVDLEGFMKETFPERTSTGFQCGETWIDFPKDFGAPLPE